MTRVSRTTRQFALILAAATATLLGQETPAAAPEDFDSPKFETLKPVKMKAPRYPAFARANRIEGTVVLSAVVTAEGKVTNVTPISGNSLFAPPAVAAIYRWTYRPATVGGVPVDSPARIVVRFRMNKEPGL